MRENLTRETLHTRLEQAIARAQASGQLSLAETPGVPSFWVRRAAAQYGEFASNVALTLAAVCWPNEAKDTTGRALATPLSAQAVAVILIEQLKDVLEWPGCVTQTNGFLNFQMDDTFLTTQMSRAVSEGARYGSGSRLAGKRVNIEFVSADPTGPLPFAAGRIAANGEALCRLLEWQGADVTREFYLNDVESSSKMRLLGESVAALYLSAFGREGEEPEGALTDDFVRDVARAVVEREGNACLLLPDAERAAKFAHSARETAVASQRQTLREFGVRFDVWTSENILREEGRVRSAIQKLEERGHTYQRDGALWLRTTNFGDETDRPLVRANGQLTYLAADIAYHLFKMERGFDLLLNIWTVGHRPYIARTRAALQAAGCAVDKLEVLLCEGARALRDGNPVVAGKGGGAFTLDEALHEVSADLLRFWLLSGDWDTGIDLDLETARREDETNPAYAARLAPARLGTMIRELEAASHATGVNADAGVNAGTGTTPAWSEPEHTLLRLVALWPDEAETAALQRAPQRVTRFVTEMSAAVRELLSNARPRQSNSDDANASSATAQRLQLLRAAQITISNALRILSIAADERF